MASKRSVRMRVRAAAEAALAKEKMVSLLDVLVGMGLLAYSSYQSWQRGRQKHLDVQIQGGEELHSQVMRHYTDWIQKKGLKPLSTAYVIGSRSGTKPLQIFEEYSEDLERMYGTRFALPEAQEKLEKKLQKPPDLVVIIASGREDIPCSGCEEPISPGDVLLMEDGGPLCMECADMDHLDFLPSGDAALTRRAKKSSPLAAVVVTFSKSRKRYERQGILVTREAIEKAEDECVADADERAARREKRRGRVAVEDRELTRQVATAIMQQYPKCPAEDANAIAEHTTRRGSGRVGRSAAAKALDPAAIRLAVRAHVRHAHTNYDGLLMQGVTRGEARAAIHRAVEDVISEWAG